MSGTACKYLKNSGWESWRGGGGQEPQFRPEAPGPFLSYVNFRILLILMDPLRYFYPILNNRQKKAWKLNQTMEICVEGEFQLRISSFREKKENWLVNELLLRWFSVLWVNVKKVKLANQKSDSIQLFWQLHKAQESSAQRISCSKNQVLKKSSAQRIKNQETKYQVLKESRISCTKHKNLVLDKAQESSEL